MWSLKKDVDRKVVEEMVSFDVSLSDFGKMRTEDKYYVDKSLFIQEFIERNETITLITRPRRFGKTTLMTMLADFFDIERTSGKRFEDLEIMDTKYASLLNSRPVIFLSFRDCDMSHPEDLRKKMNRELYREYDRLEKAIHEKINPEDRNTEEFLDLLTSLHKKKADFEEVSESLYILIRTCQEYYDLSPLVLIDEYDQPLLAGYLHGYHQEVKDYLAAFYTKALKDNPFVYKALMTGIQRMAKESIFSKFNNPAVYTVANKGYSTCFGFTEEETDMVLKEAGLKLDEETREMYDGYRFGGVSIYNPSSIMGYAQNQERRSYWVNTSSNRLIRDALAHAGQSKDFRMKYEELLKSGQTKVFVSLYTSYMEMSHTPTLWGLLVNAGYLTILSKDENNEMCLMIPNKEIRSEFIQMLAEEMGMEPNVLQTMFAALDRKDMECFFQLYQELVLTNTSFYDGKENAYHMFFLGMCISLYGKYKVTSNLESGYGRHDIMLEPQKSDRNPIIIEFKQANVNEDADIKHLARSALTQIIDKKYYAPLHGNILLVGIGHQGKRCEMIYETIEN